MAGAQSAAGTAPIPPQIPYIIGNEGCERFSFYGMRNILTVFLVSSLLTYLPEAERAEQRDLIAESIGQDVIEELGEDAESLRPVL